MGQDGDLQPRVGQVIESRQPEQHRRDHHRPDADLLSQVGLPVDLVWCAREVGQVERTVARPCLHLIDGSLAGPDAFFERAEGMITQVMIVFDQIDPALGEGAAQRGEALYTQAHRFKSSSRQGACRHADTRSQAGQAKLRPAKQRVQRWWHIEVFEGYVGVQRCIAEEHVQKLRGVG